MLKKCILIIVVLFIFCSVSFSQINQIGNPKINKSDSSHATEKVYLQTDRTDYNPGDTIWFKAYVVETPLNSPSEISKVLYVELTCGDSLIKRLTLQLDPGIGWGDFLLPADCKTGVYHLRAYTNWMRNNNKSFYEHDLNVDQTTSKKDLQIINANQQNIDSGKLDIHFYTEGGYLINGLRSKAVLKISENNLLKLSRGVIINSENKEVAAFTFNTYGFAQFAFTPQVGVRYKVVLSSSTDGNYIINLPAAKSEGFVLTINNNDADSIHIKISLSEKSFKKLQNSSVYLTGLSAGEIYYSTLIKIDSRTFRASINKDRLPAGVTQFSLVSPEGMIFNERLIFIKNKNQLTLKLDTMHTELNKKIRFNLNAKNLQGSNVIGSFSVSVIKDNDTLSYQENIITNLLLKSDLESVNNFSDLKQIDLNNENTSDLDMRMIAANYKRSDLKKLLADSIYNPKHLPQTSLSLSGKASFKDGKPVAGRKIKLTSVKDFFTADTVTDVNGKFFFDNIDLADSTKVFISTQKVKGKNNIKITIDEPQYPPVYIYPEDESANNPQVYAQKVKQQQSSSAINTTLLYGNLLDSLPKARRLKEVVIKSYKNKRNNFFQPKFDDNIKHSVNLHGAGNADEVILADDLPFRGSLTAALPGRTAGLISWQNGIPGGQRNPMMILLEGSRINADELQSINVDDVYSIELLRHRNFTSIYGLDGMNGVMIITMRHGAKKNPDKAKTDDGTITYIFKGFNMPDKFYLKDIKRLNNQKKAAKQNDLLGAKFSY